MLIAVIGALAAWYGVKLCLLNRTLVTPGLEINLACSMPRRWSAACCWWSTPSRCRGAAAAPITSIVPLRARLTCSCSLVAAIFVVLIAVLDADRVRARRRRAWPACAIGGYDLQMLSSSLVSGSQSWVLLAIPAFVFAGGLMEKCGMSHALVDFARALVGWVKGGLGMSVIVVAYFFSDICGSKMAEVSALGSTLMPPLTKAGYKRRGLGLADRRRHGDGHAGAAGDLHDRDRPGHQHLGGGAVPRRLRAGRRHHGLPDGPGLISGARKYDWPVDTQAERRRSCCSSARRAAVPLVIPIVILGGFFLGVFTATEAGAVVAGYAFFAARFYYRNVSWREMAELAYDSAHPDRRR